MAFKMKGYQAHDKSPLKVGGKWSNWAADNKAFIDKEIQDRRKAKGGDVDKSKDKDKNTTPTTTKTTDNTPKPTPKPTTTNNEEPKGRVEYAKNDPILSKYVKKGEGEIVKNDDGTETYKPGEDELSSYAEAWDDGRFTVSKDGKTKTAPAELGGASYPNTPAGLKQFETASEQWYKDNPDVKRSNLNIDSQTGKESTHEVWD